MATVEAWTPHPRTGRPRWRARWRTPAGESRGRVCSSKTAARNLGVRMEAAKLDGTYHDDRNTTTVDELVITWLATQGHLDPSTLELAERRLRRHVLPQLGEVLVVQLRPSQIRAWLTGLQLAAGTARGTFDLLNATLQAAVDDGIRPDNPCRARSVHPPQPAAGEVQPFAPEGAERIIAAHPARYRALATTAFGCGHRQGEAFAIAADDIDWLGRWIHIRRQLKRVGGHLVLAPPKGGRRRKVPLPETVSFALAEHIRLFGTHDLELPTLAGADNPGGFLFTTPNATPLRAAHYNASIWKPAVATAGLPAGPRQNTMHKTRHTYASKLLAEGESIAAVSRWLGHANQAITLRIYSHLMPDAADRTRRIIDDAFPRVTAVSQIPPDLAVVQ